MRNVLIVDKAHHSLSEKLNEVGWCCTTDLDFSYNSFLDFPDSISGLIIRSRFQVDKAIIDSKPSLKFIVRLGSGVENIDVEYAESKGITVISTPEGNANAVAEHCLALLLNGLRHVAVSGDEVRVGKWLREKNKGSELSSHTYGIIGFGHTGQAFAKILNSLNCKVLAYDKYHPEKIGSFATRASLEEICKTCDVISLNVNYIPDNHHFIDDKFVDSVLQNFMLINTSRGAVVDSNAVINGLRSGKILYAGLDVLEFENVNLKIPEFAQWPETLSQLAQFENVTLTPHVGGQTFEAERRHADFAVKKISALKLFD